MNLFKKKSYDDGTTVITEETRKAREEFGMKSVKIQGAEQLLEGVLSLGFGIFQIVRGIKALRKF